MSDHVDGPRSIGDPPADITDLFAFTSPENPARTVLAMCVFPSAGESAVFSNVIDHRIIVRRVAVAAADTRRGHRAVPVLRDDPRRGVAMAGHAGIGAGGERVAELKPWH